MHSGSLENTEEARATRLSPRANLTHLSCSPNFPGASITRYTHARHEQILKCWPPWVEYNLPVTFMTMFVALSLQSPCSAVVCGNKRKCVSLFKENSYVCICKEGFTGRNCETGKIAAYASDLRLI